MPKDSVSAVRSQSIGEERLFVVVDPRDRTHVALQRAIITSLLRERLPKLYVYICVDTEAVGDQRDDLLFDQQWIDSNIRQPLTENALPYEIELSWSPRWLESILKSSERFAADMIMVPAHSLDAGTPFVMSRHKWELLQYATCPTLIVRENSKPRRELILAAVNSQASKHEQQALNRRILEHGARVATRYDAEFHIVNAYRDSLWYPDWSFLRRQTGLSPDHIHVRQGYTDKVVPSVAAELGADIVVAGMLNQRGTTSTIRGNTTARLLAALEVDTLIVN